MGDNSGTLSLQQQAVALQTRLAASLAQDRPVAPELLGEIEQLLKQVAGAGQGLPVIPDPYLRYREAEAALAQRAAQLALINEIGSQINAMLELDNLLYQAAALVQQTFGYHHVALFLLEGDVAVLKAVAGSYQGFFPPHHTQKLSEGIIGWVATHGEKVVANDVSREPRYISLIPDRTETRAELCLPLKVAGQTVGVLNIQSPRLHAFSRNDVVAMQILTDQIAVALENARLYEAVRQELTERRRAEQELKRYRDHLEELVQERTAKLMAAVTELRQEMVERQQAQKALRESEARFRRRAAELQALHETALRLNAQLETAELLQLIAEQVIALLEAEAAAVYVYDSDLEKLVVSVGVGSFSDRRGVSVKPGQGPAGRAFESRRPLVVSHPGSPEEAGAGNGDSRLGTLLAVPLLGPGAALGVLDIGSREQDAFDAYDIWLAELFAAQAAVALENSHLHSETQSRARELAILIKAGRAMTSTLDLETVLSQTIIEVQSLLEAEDAAILLREGSGKDLVFAAVARPASRFLVGIRVPAGAGIAAWVVREKQPVLINNAQADPRFYDQIDKQSGLKTGSLLAVPLIFQDRASGVIEVINKNKGLFSRHDRELLEALAGSAVIAIENARLYEAERAQFRRLQQSQAQLIRAEKMTALGRLGASIAHEINNPMQAIQSCLNLIEEDLKGKEQPDRMGTYLSIAGKEIERVSTIVRRMREFYRPTPLAQRPTSDSDSLDAFYRSTPAEWRPYALPEVLDSVLQLTNKELQNNQIRVERVWAEDLPRLRGQADHLKQVFLNLILNAIDAMAGQAGTLEVTMGLGQLQAYGAEPQPAVCVQIRDTGMGMSQEQLDQLFEPFVTTKEQGSGLGLFISYKVIEAHGGQISASSQVGGGTTFTILLPVTPPAQEEPVWL